MKVAFYKGRARLFNLLGAVQAGERPAPADIPALLAELPQFDWANY